MNKNQKILALIFGFAIVSAIALALVTSVNAYLTGNSIGVTERIPTIAIKEVQNYTFFTATTTTATSTNTASGAYFGVAGARNVNFYFSRGGATGANTGLTVFKVEVTPDGTNWYPYNRLQLNDATGSGTTTVTINAATSTTIATMANNGWKGIRCIAVETTDGEHTCKATAEFGY